MSRLKNPWVMTRQQVKDVLQITVVDYDALIDQYLPIVSADIEKITNNTFVISRTGDFTDASATVSGVVTKRLDFGDVVSYADFEQVEIVDIDDEHEQIVVDASATGDSTDADFLVNIFPRAKKPIAAQMVLYNIKKYTSDQTNFAGPLASETVGSYSWTAADGGKGGAGYPAAIVNTLKEITRPRVH